MTIDMNDQYVHIFFYTTYSVWSSGHLNTDNPEYQKEAQRIGPQGIGQLYLSNSILRHFLETYLPIRGEYLVGSGEGEAMIGKAYWFITTNYRLFLKDGKTKMIHLIPLCQIRDFKKKGWWTATLDITMMDGQQMTLSKIPIHPRIEHIQYLLNLQEWSQLNEFEMSLMMAGRSEALKMIAQSNYKGYCNPSQPSSPYMDSNQPQK